MGAVLVFCESDDKGVRSASLPALSAGAALAKLTGGDLAAVVIGKGVAAAAADAAKYAKRVLVYDDAKLEAPLAETWAPQLADAVKRAGASALLGTASSTGKDILPRAAALLGAGMASDITAVLAANRFKRPAYAGNAMMPQARTRAQRSARAAARGDRFITGSSSCAIAHGSPMQRVCARPRRTHGATFRALPQAIGAVRVAASPGPQAGEGARRNSAATLRRVAAEVSRSTLPSMTSRSSFGASPGAHSFARCTTR